MQPTMSTRFHPLRPARAAPYVLVAALQAACVMCIAWPCAAHAQQPATAGGQPSPASANGQPGDDLSAAARRARADEERMLGGPSSAGNPYQSDAYSSDGASPAAQANELTSEARMRIVTPSNFYAAGGVAAATSAGGRNDTRGGTDRIRQRPGRATAGKYDPADDPTTGSGAWAAYDYGASTTSPTAPIYGNPYTSQREAAEKLYRSPW